MPIGETSLEHLEIPFKIAQHLTGEERILLVLELSMRRKEMIKARIRVEHPDWTETQVRRELLRLEFLPNPLPRGF